MISICLSSSLHESVLRSSVFALKFQGGVAKFSGARFEVLVYSVFLSSQSEGCARIRLEFQYFGFLNLESLMYS